MADTIPDDAKRLIAEFKSEDKGWQTTFARKEHEINWEKRTLDNLRNIARHYKLEVSSKTGGRHSTKVVDPGNLNKAGKPKSIASVTVHGGSGNVFREGTWDNMKKDILSYIQAKKPKRD